VKRVLEKKTPSQTYDDDGLKVLAQPQRPAMFHYNQVAAFEPWLHLLYEVEVHNQRALDSHEVCGVQFPLQTQQCFARLETLSSREYVSNLFSKEGQHE
jgi:hypothetical protein